MKRRHGDQRTIGSGIERQRAQAAVGLARILARVGGALDGGERGALERVHARIGVGPQVGELVAGQRTQDRARVVELEQLRPGRDQQADGELDRIDRVVEVARLDELQQLQIIRERGPGRERQQRRAQRDPGGAHDAERLVHVGARVPLVEQRQHPLRQRLHRAHDEHAAERPQLGEHAAMTQDVLDLGGDVEAHPGMLGVQRNGRSAARARAR